MNFGPNSARINEMIIWDPILSDEQLDRMDGAKGRNYYEARDEALRTCGAAGKEYRELWRHLTDKVHSSALQNAALALIMQDKISASNFNTLIYPWFAVMEG